MKNIDVWWVRVSGVGRDELAACERWLAPAEFDRAGRLRFAEDRRLSLLGRALLRAALSWRDGRPPAEWRFEQSPRGRPLLAGDEPWGFSVSHTGGAVVCAVGPGGQVGVDVEACRGAEVWDEVAGRAFTPAERSRLERMQPEEKSAHACSLWTLKEAYSKARGLGLAIPFDKIGFETRAGVVDFQPDSEVEPDASKWSFLSLEPEADFRLGVCWSGGGDAVFGKTGSPLALLHQPSPPPS